MNKLSFVVQPKHEPIIEYIGSQESGQIAIERRGYLTSGEKAFVQQALGADETSLKVIGLSRKVANHQKISLDEAYQTVIAVMSGQGREDHRNLEIEKEFFEDFNEILGHLANVQSREQLLKALCMVQYRIDSKFDVDDILGLHPDIINGLAELYDEEEKRSIERLISAESEVDANDNKSQEVDVNELEKKRRPRARMTSD